MNLRPGIAITLLLGAGAATAEDAGIRVAIYDDAGIGGGGPDNVEKCLKEAGGFTVEHVKAGQIRSGILSRFDVVVQPGGSAGKQAHALGDAGCEAIRKFVEGGGGYLGFCAGSYLATTDRPGYLKILDAKILDTEHWARGSGPVRIRLSLEGKSVLGGTEEVVGVHYGQGPLLAPGGDPAIEDFKTLATYETEIARNGAPSGVMKGSVAAATGTYGKGRVFCFSPHPEKTAGIHAFVSRAALWAAGKSASAPVSAPVAPAAPAPASPPAAPTGSPPPPTSN